jgi:hypothetical protein
MRYGRAKIPDTAGWGDSFLFAPRTIFLSHNTRQFNGRGEKKTRSERWGRREKKDFKMAAHVVGVFFFNDFKRKKKNLLPNIFFSMSTLDFLIRIWSINCTFINSIFVENFGIWSQLDPEILLFLQERQCEKATWTSNSFWVERDAILFYDCLRLLDDSGIKSQPT